MASTLSSNEASIGKTLSDRLSSTWCSTMIRAPRLVWCRANWVRMPSKATQGSRCSVTRKFSPKNRCTSIMGWPTELAPKNTIETKFS